MVLKVLPVKARDGLHVAAHIGHLQFAAVVEVQRAVWYGVRMYGIGCLRSNRWRYMATRIAGASTTDP